MNILKLCIDVMIRRFVLWRLRHRLSTVKFLIDFTKGEHTYILERDDLEERIEKLELKTGTKYHICACGRSLRARLKKNGYKFKCKCGYKKIIWN